MRHKLKIWFVRILASVLVVATVLLYLSAKGNPAAQAMFTMVIGLVVVWVFIGGALMYKFRDRVRDIVLRLPLGWKIKFVLFATALGLLEEAITTGLTNMAPVFGVGVGEAYITASANYFDVIFFHSIVAILPLFIAMAILLGRYQFSPFAAFIIFGFVGTIAEAIFSGNLAMIATFYQWVFVYGLMIYLPAYCLPYDRGARPVRFWHYIIAIPLVFILALPMLIPLALVINGFLHHPSIHFPPM